MSLKLENHAQNSLLDCDFQKDIDLEGQHVKGQNLIMDPKKSSEKKRHTLEGHHVEGHDRGKEIKL
jgi:hypothetical protein